MLNISSDISDIVVFFLVWYHKMVTPEAGRPSSPDTP